MLRDLIRALQLIPRHRRWQWSALVPMALAEAVLEGIGAGVVLALGTVVAAPTDRVRIPMVSWIIDRQPATSPEGLVIGVATGVLVFYVVRGLLLTLFAWIQEVVVQRT